MLRRWNENVDRDWRLRVLSILNVMVLMTGRSDQHKVCARSSCPVTSLICPVADVEAEDLDLGDLQAGDLALDVDADMADEDPEALDSDEDTEEHQLDKELGLDSSDADGKFFFQGEESCSISCSSDAHCSSIFLTAQRETDVGV